MKRSDDMLYCQFWKFCKFGQWCDSALTDEARKTAEELNLTIHTHSEVFGCFEEKIEAVIK